MSLSVPAPMRLPPRLYRDLALLVLSVVVLAVPFLHQPFHMDDNFYMDMARNARLTWLYPNDTPYVFEGKHLPDMASHSHPPLQTYALAVVQSLVGEGAGKERFYHSACLLFPVIAVIAFYFLAALFVERPIWPALLLAGAPTFLVMQHTLMTDVPTLAYWLGAISAFVWAVETGSRRGYAVSSLFQFAAVFTSYQSLVLAPLLGFYQFRKGKGASGWLALILPPIALMGWLILNCTHYHRFILWNTVGYVQSRDAWSLYKLSAKVAALLQYQGWLIVFPVFLLYAFCRGLHLRLVAVAGLIVACAVQVGLPHYRLQDKAAVVVGLSAGLVVTWRMILLLQRTEDAVGSNHGWSAIGGQFLFLWYFGVIASCVFLFTDGSARYTLPLLPPVLLVFCRRMETRQQAHRDESIQRARLGALACGAAATTVAWGLALSHADLEFASIYPRAAREFSRITGGREAYYGGEWGFRYYFGQAGVRQLQGNAPLPGGSWIVRPRLALPYELDKTLEAMTNPTHRISYRVATPLRLLAQGCPAGFYSTWWGKAPFSLSFDSLESIEIRQVDYLVERLPEATIDVAEHGLPRAGRLSLGGKNCLALLLKPGTRISYLWTDPNPLVMKFKCGVSPEAYRQGDDSNFSFEISQCDAKGNALASLHLTLHPGTNGDHRMWQPAQLKLLPRGQAEFLQLRYDASSHNVQGAGAFAECVLLRAAPEQQDR